MPLAVLMDRRLQTADCRLTESDPVAVARCPSPVLMDRRLQTADCRLKAFCRPMPVARSPLYSCRIAAAGSMVSARRAGSAHAARDTSASTAVTPPSASGSAGETS